MVQPHALVLPCRVSTCSLHRHLPRQALSHCRSRSSRLSCRRDLLPMTGSAHHLGWRCLIRKERSRGLLCSSWEPPSSKHTENHQIGQGSRQGSFQTGSALKSPLMACILDSLRPFLVLLETQWVERLYRSSAFKEEATTDLTFH